MKNLKHKFLIVTLFVSTSMVSMELPPPRPQTSFDSLPNDVKRLLVPMIASSKVYEVANTIRSLNATNTFFHNYFSNPAGLIAILERMPYTANAVDLVENYLSKTNIPVVKSPQIESWLKDAKSRLVNGRELWVAAMFLNQNKIRELLRYKDINLNYEMPSNNDQTSLMVVLSVMMSESLEKRPNGLKITQLLLDAGANPDLKDKFGKSARDYAVEYKNPELIRLFDEAKKKR